jgi:hypothetical protein
MFWALALWAEADRVSPFDNSNYVSAERKYKKKF